MCEHTFLARRDFLGRNGNVIKTVMKWHYCPASQLEVVSEPYLQEALGCTTTASDLHTPRGIIFPKTSGDGILIKLHRLPSGLQCVLRLQPDCDSRASPAVIQAGARRATRGRIGYSESAVLLHYYNGYAAVAALAGASFEIVANMTRPDPCAV